MIIAHVIMTIIVEPGGIRDQTTHESNSVMQSTNGSVDEQAIATDAGKLNIMYSCCLSSADTS